MGQEYLPGKVRDRIRDLMKERNVNQIELAQKTGITESTLSRFLSGSVSRLSDENIVAIARSFDVSTDFLLGLASIPDRMDYEIAELGLSVRAAKTLCTSKTSAAAVNALLEHESFPALAQMILQYIEGTAAAGYAAQNQMYSMLAAALAGEDRAAANAIRNLRTPVYQADAAHIQSALLKILNELREKSSEKIEASKALTKEVLQKLVAGLPKGKQLRTLTPEQIMDAVVSTVSGMDGVSEEQLTAFRASALPLFQRPVKIIHHADAKQ